MQSDNTQNDIKTNSTTVLSEPRNNNLYVNIILNISYYLDINALCRLAQTSRFYYQFYQNPAILAILIDHQVLGPHCRLRVGLTLHDLFPFSVKFSQSKNNNQATYCLNLYHELLTDFRKSLDGFSLKLYQHIINWPTRHLDLIDDLGSFHELIESVGKVPLLHALFTRRPIIYNLAEFALSSLKKEELVDLYQMIEQRLLQFYKPYSQNMLSAMIKEPKMSQANVRSDADSDADSSTHSSDVRVSFNFQTEDDDFTQAQTLQPHELFLFSIYFNQPVPKVIFSATPEIEQALIIKTLFAKFEPDFHSWSSVVSTMNDLGWCYSFFDNKPYVRTGVLLPSQWPERQGLQLLQANAHVQSRLLRLQEAAMQACLSTNDSQSDFCEFFVRDFDVKKAFSMTSVLAVYINVDIVGTIPEEERKLVIKGLSVAAASEIAKNLARAAVSDMHGVFAYFIESCVDVYAEFLLEKLFEQLQSQHDPFIKELFLKKNAFIYAFIEQYMGHKEQQFAMPFIERIVELPLTLDVLLQSSNAKIMLYMRKWLTIYLTLTKDKHKIERLAYLEAEFHSLLPLCYQRINRELKEIRNALGLKKDKKSSSSKVNAKHKEDSSDRSAVTKLPQESAIVKKTSDKDKKNKHSKKDKNEGKHKKTKKSKHSAKHKEKHEAPPAKNSTLSELFQASLVSYAFSHIETSTLKLIARELPGFLVAILSAVVAQHPMIKPDDTSFYEDVLLWMNMLGANEIKQLMKYKNFSSLCESLSAIDSHAVNKIRKAANIIAAGASCQQDKPTKERVLPHPTVQSPPTPGVNSVLTVYRHKSTPVKMEFLFSRVPRSR